MLTVSTVANLKPAQICLHKQPSTPQSAVGTHSVCSSFLHLNWKKKYRKVLQELEVATFVIAHFLILTYTITLMENRVLEKNC